MKSDDLTKNALLDDGVKVAKKAVSGYEKAQTWLMYLAIAKWSGIGIIVLLLSWGGYSLVMGAKDMITEAAVGEAKEVATAKYEDAKAKVKEKTEGKSVQSLTGGLFALAKSASAKMDEAVDIALAESGFDADAPANCALQDPTAPSSECLRYSNVEIGGDKYREIKVLWPDVCPPLYDELTTALKTDGKVTHNVYRKLNNRCDAYLDRRNETDVESMKRKMLEGM